jgi:hypothetical protein
VTDGTTSPSLSGSGPEIDADEFDMMLARSLSFSTSSALEPESSENSLLRGPRRYTAERGQSGHEQPSSFDTFHKTTSSSNQTIGRNQDRRIDADTTAQASTSSPPGDRAVQGALTAPLCADDETSPLLGTKLPAITPFLSDITPIRFWLIFSVVLTTCFIACFDGTIMASSHPVITSYFGASHSASWLSTAFMLASTAFQPLLGRLSDTLGRKWLYIAMQALFGLATVGCALAGSIVEFIVARAFCGLGAGGMLTMASIILSDLVPIE